MYESFYQIKDQATLNVSHNKNYNIFYEVLD